MKLRDSSVEGGDPVFVTFELGNAESGQPVNISPGIVLRRESRDLNVLIARTPEFNNYPPIAGSGAALPTVSLTPGTEYRFELPDIEPGFHHLCAKYTIGGVPAETCTELALT